jgi:hypothetical protein
MLRRKQTLLASGQEQQLCAHVGHMLGAPDFLKADIARSTSAD